MALWGGATVSSGLLVSEKMFDMARPEWLPPSSLSEGASAVWPHETKNQMHVSIHAPFERKLTFSVAGPKNCSFTVDCYLNERLYLPEANIYCKGNHSAAYKSPKWHGNKRHIPSNTGSKYGPTTRA